METMPGPLVLLASLPLMLTAVGLYGAHQSRVEVPPGAERDRLEGHHRVALARVKFASGYALAVSAMWTLASGFR